MSFCGPSDDGRLCCIHDLRPTSVLPPPGSPPERDTPQACQLVQNAVLLTAQCEWRLCQWRVKLPYFGGSIIHKYVLLSSVQACTPCYTTVIILSLSREIMACIVFSTLSYQQRRRQRLAPA